MTVDNGNLLTDVVLSDNKTFNLSVQIINDYDTSVEILYCPMWNVL